MRSSTQQLFPASLQDDIGVDQQIFYNFISKRAQQQVKQPNIFTQSDKDLIQKPKNKDKFDKSTLAPNLSAFEHPKSIQIEDKLKIDKLLNKIIQNQSQINSSQQKEKNLINQTQFYSFNYDLFYVFAQTPEFKQSLSSPLRKFCNQFTHKICQLQQLKLYKPFFKQLHLQFNPNALKKQPALYFVGLALNYKKLGHLMQTLFFYHLAIYSSPFDEKVWENYIQTLQKNGLWKEAFKISKTGFLFNSKVNIGEQYLFSGQRVGAPPFQLRGLLSSLKQPSNYQKLIIQSGKLQMKRRKVWRGMWLIYKYCLAQDFSSFLFQSVLLLSKNLLRLNYQYESDSLLTIVLNQKSVKFQVYDFLIQSLMRQTLNLTVQQIKYILEFVKNSVIETKFRIYLGIAESVGNPELQSKYYLESLKSVRNQKFQDQSRKKAYRQIYFRVLSSYSISPSEKICKLFQNDDYLKFYSNKSRFVNGLPLQLHDFKDWKFYLHYALERNCQVLEKAYKQFQQGRILAEYFHIIRIRKSPLSVLKLWRKKIEQAPKSGQLWCQGGRVYAELGQFWNAKRCYETAIHFTPQYGDSFLELLKIYMIQCSFYQINQLKKNFFMSEPYYGNIFTFLRMETQFNCIKKQSLNILWQKCMYKINQILYNKNTNLKLKHFTALQEYNECFTEQRDRKARKKLFISYELIQNKFAK